MMMDRLSAGTMPEPLYQLAEALLAKKQDDAFFDRLMESEL